MNQKVFVTSMFSMLAVCLISVGCVLLFFPQTQSESISTQIPAPYSSSQNRTLKEAIQVNSPPEGNTLVKENKTSEYDSDFYLGNTIFIGDSRTHGFLSYNYFPPEQVYSMDGCTQKNIQGEKIADLGDEELFTVDEAVGKRRPQRILLAFGVNAIATMSESEFMSSYISLVDSLKKASPESAIIIQSIMPVSMWLERQNPDINNESIEHYNNLLYKYAADNGYYYMNTAEIMTDDDNSLDSKYDAGDGLHFNTSAYDALIEYYESHMILTEDSMRTPSDDWNLASKPSSLIGESSWSIGSSVEVGYSVGTIGDSNISQSNKDNTQIKETRPNQNLTIGQSEGIEIHLPKNNRPILPGGYEHKKIIE